MRRQRDIWNAEFLLKNRAEKAMRNFLVSSTPSQQQNCGLNW